MGNTVSRSTVTSQLNNMTATILTNISMNCSTLSTNSQIISIDCAPRSISTAYESNATCRQCISNILVSKKEEYTRYANLAKAGNPVPNIPNINLDLHYTAEAMRACGRNVCKACVIEDISQNNVVSISVDCQATNNIQNQVSQSLTNAIMQKLSTDYDIFGSVANILGGRDVQTVSNSISNRVKNIITNNLITTVYNEAKNNQSFIINVTEGEFNGISQQSTFNSIVKYLSDNNIFNSIMSDSEWTTLQTLHDSNNVTGQMTAGFITANRLFTDMLHSTIGYIMLAVMICMCLAAFYVIAITVYEYRNLSLGLTKEGDPIDEVNGEKEIKLPYVSYFPKTYFSRKIKHLPFPKLF